MNTTPELLLPVGNMDMCLAAIHNGANAIYVGMPEFNARGRTTDHSFEQLEEIINLCHLNDVKVHVAFNILIFEDELEKAMELIGKLIPLSPDAIIVQDLGLVSIIKAIAPEQTIHASTQMTITNEYAIELTRDLDIERYVLGRENSIPEITKIKEATDKELEVFVHGALCVAYSGQCFTSESIGGRSANRGQCAQSCRFDYELIVDGEKKELIDQKYLVSPQDLCGINEVDKLSELGIDSLKVEGRLKSPQFVASVARSYRKALDGEKNIKSLSNEMAITYSRGFFSGWLNGVDHQNLVDGSFGSNRGLKVGQVLEIKRNAILIGSDLKINKGDGLLFTSVDSSHKIEVGAKAYEVFPFRNGRFEIRFSRDFDINKVQSGFNVYLNSSSALTKELTKSFTDKHSFKKTDVKIKVTAIVGNPIKVVFNYKGIDFGQESEMLIEQSKNELNIKNVQKELSSLGSTPFKAIDFNIETKGTSPFLPNKVLKELRRSICKKIEDYLHQRDVIELQDFSLNSIQEKFEIGSPKLRILLREIDQVVSFLEKLNKETQLKEFIDSIILDFEFGKNYKAALELVRAADIRCAIATNRILKPGEYHHLKVLIRLAPDYILARNLGAKQFLSEFAPEIEVAGDFSLNIANSHTSDYLFNKGFTTLTPGYDLNEDQLIELVKHSSNKNFELTIHQYMPSFHMEHCVYAAFLSEGSSFRDCGKPCEKHKVELHDSFGNKHFIKADQECRNTMFNATSIGAASLIEKTNDLGVSLYRIEALFEDGKAIFDKFVGYTKLIKKEQTVDELNKYLGQSENYGLSSGQLFKKDQYLDRKK
jgi:putative protease